MILQKKKKTHTLATLIWLVVNVPVLSAQMTFVQPRVSTEGKDRTIAFFLAIFFVPRARQVVMTTGSPSGIAATASATAIYRNMNSKREGSALVAEPSQAGIVRVPYLEVVNSSLSPSTMTRIIKVTQIDDPDQQTNNTDDFRQQVSKIVDFLLQGGLFGNLRGDGGVDVTDGGSGTG